MRTTPVGVAALIVIAIAGAPGGTQAKGKYDCKPAITGWGSDGFVHKAKGKAIASYKAKAAAAYGTIVWNNTIGDHCLERYIPFNPTVVAIRLLIVSCFRPAL